jgi:nucleoside-triphosphatase THEP1
VDEGTPRLLVEGRPGIGKSPLAGRLVTLLQRAGVSVGGFTTDELRTGGRREGFVVEAVSGGRELLAHVDLPGPPRVGRDGGGGRVLLGVVPHRVEHVTNLPPLPLLNLGKLEKPQVRW